MKNILHFIIGIALIASCTKPVKNNFVINGTIDTAFDGYAYLQTRGEGSLTTIDSALIVNKAFQFKGTVKFPEVYYINVKATKSLVPFFIEPSEITINLKTKKIDDTEILGSKTQNEYEKYLDEIDKFNFKMRESYTYYQQAEEAGDQAKMHMYDSAISATDVERSEYVKNFGLENIQSAVSPYIVYRNSYDYNEFELEKTLNGFDTTLNASPYTVLLKDYLKTLKRTAVGMLYVSFMMKDTTGLYFPVANLIGEKYLLIDFWASWCAPCRAENPNLVATYNEFKDKGFEILGVSLDTNHDRWIKAIKDDNLTWYHVCDLFGWDNAAAKIYGIKSIPSNVLIDKSGYIIAKNLRVEDLKKKLQELFPAGV